MEMDRKIRNSDEGQKMVAIGGLQNMAWAADTSKFGFKMLVKMGWSAGKGVGKDLQGQISHVKIARRSENLGLGCSLKQAEVQGWSNTAQSFADVLASLNKSYRNSDENSGSDEKSKAKKEKKSNKEKKLKKSKKKKTSTKMETTTMITRRILYHKRVNNKNAKSYDVNDMTAILGMSSSTFKSVATSSN